MIKDNKNRLKQEIDKYLHRLFYVNRSIMGDGNRETLKILQEIVPLEVKEYRSGETIYDWTIPSEWSVRSAWIANAEGEKIVDFAVNNLHLVGYSVSVDAFLTFEELESHIYTHPVIPDAIPYRTSYYKNDWGFCVTKEQYDRLRAAKHKLRIFIDSKFKPNGSLSIGELVLPGDSDKEILISTYICHPSMANDNLSGVLLSAFLARQLVNNKRKYGYRFVWVPETIGAIAYCAHNEHDLKKIETGLVITTVGGSGRFGYKQSFQRSHIINQLVEEVFDENNIEYIRYPFDINGSDERQYSSPAFRINTVSITKDKYYEYPFYHSSKDDLNFVKAEYISQTLDLYSQLILKLEAETYYIRRQPHCEIMLSKYGLYPEVGGGILPVKGSLTELDLIRWVLFLSDGLNSILSISSYLGIEQGVIEKYSDMLTEADLLEKI